MDDIIKQIYEAETNKEALQILQNRYIELNNNSDEVLLADNDVNAIEIHRGFLNQNSKITYAQSFGATYKVDLFDDLDFFVNCIRNNKISNKNTFLNALPGLTIAYFGAVRSSNDTREDAIQEMLSQTKTDEEYFAILNNSKISQFKGKGIAQCTEFASLTSVLVSLAGFESYFIMGEMNIGSVNEGHAYNIVQASDGNYYLMDNANPHCVYDESNKLIGVRPNIFQLSEETLSSFLNQEITLNVPLYNGRVDSSGSIKKIDCKKGEYVSGNPKSKGISK